MVRSTQPAAVANIATRSLPDLPPDVLQTVFGNLVDSQDVISLGRTSRRLHAIARDRTGPVAEANGRDLHSDVAALRTVMANGGDLYIVSRRLSTAQAAPTIPDSAVHEIGRWLASWKLSDHQRFRALSTMRRILPRLTDDEIENIGKRLIGFGLPRFTADGVLVFSIAELSSIVPRMKLQTQKALLELGQRRMTEWRRPFTSEDDWQKGGKARNDRRTQKLNIGTVACFHTLDATQRDSVVHQLDGVNPDSIIGDEPLFTHWSNLTEKQAYHVLLRYMSNLRSYGCESSELRPEVIGDLRKIIGTGDHLNTLRRARDMLLKSANYLAKGSLLGALLNQDGEHGLQLILGRIDQGSVYDRDESLSVLSYGTCMPVFLQNRILSNPYFPHCIPNIARFDQHHAEALMAKAWSTEPYDVSRLCMPVLASLPHAYQRRWLEQFKVQLINSSFSGRLYIFGDGASEVVPKWQELAQPVRDEVVDAIVSRCGHPDFCLAASEAVSALLPLLERHGDTWRRAVSFLVEAGRTGCKQSDPYALRLIIRHNTINLPTAERLRILAAWDPSGPVDTPD